MFNWVKGYSTIMFYIYYLVIGSFSYYYLLILAGVLFVFLLYRFPYCYSPYFFVAILVSVVFSCFISLFIRRLSVGALEFFSSFVPIGTPLYICFLVCLAETISYLMRPLVLILRPFMNMSLGCLGAAAISKLCFTGGCWIVVLVLLFFYEVFVALVHWYMVTSMLSFSVDH